MMSASHRTEQHGHRSRGRIQCPGCGSEAFNRYGRVRGKQRYCCLVCGRQFVEPCDRLPVKNRPSCPECGAPMHVYGRGDGFVRFRCANYPECKTFIKQHQVER